MVSMMDKRKSSFCYRFIFCMLPLMEEQKKLVLLSHYFFYVVCDERREKANSVLTLFFLCCLWWSQRKNSFCYHIIFLCCLWCRRRKNSFFDDVIFCKLSMMEQEQKLILWPYYFLYLVSDAEREKTHFIITLFFVSCLWWSKKKNWFCYNFISCILSMMEQEKRSFFYNIIFCMLSMMKQKKKLILL